MICWLVITDGRDDYLDEAVRSGREMLEGPITDRLMFDDTGDDSYRAELARRYPDFTVIHGGARQGFGGAIRCAWSGIDSVRFVFHHEQDFTFNETVDLVAMVRVLDRNPHVQQVALRRQPWNQQERDAGGVVERHPDEYRECSDGVSTWLEHRRFFTTNPSLYRRTLTERGWPEGAHSEGQFSVDLFSDLTACSAYWGRRDEPPKVHHIGNERSGIGY